MTKKCKICEEDYGLDNYYKYNNYLGNPYIYPYCKKCSALKAKKYKIKKFGTTNNRKIPKYVDNIRKSDKEYQRLKRANNPQAKIAYVRDYEEKNPHRKKAWMITRNAINSGKLKKESCRDCERIDVHGHHPDYSQPLDVIWLCPTHHKLEHLKVGI